MSVLFWAEHCIECAAPECYQSCDLYQPRSDKRCRRFTFGAMKNRNFGSLRNYGVEISFKKWAKLEAYGNLRLLPSKAVLWGEELIEWTAPIGNLVGSIMAKLTGKLRWQSATHIALEELVRLLGSRETDGLPDAFLLEVYNPTLTSVRLQLSFVPLPLTSENHGNSDSYASFVTTFELPHGYSQHQIEFSKLRFLTGSNRHFLISILPEADSNAHLVFLTADFVKYAQVDATQGESKRIKCVVWDLDNTLWKGVLAESDEVELRPEILSLLKHLDERGILLSIASKNNHSGGWQKLQELGVADYFVAPQINWTPKSENIRAIAGELNIGLDSIAFIDDSPFELDEVKRSLPEILCLKADQVGSIFYDPRFEGSKSAESQHRRQFYQEAVLRDEARAKFGSDYIEFLRACEITLEILPYAADDYERVAELVQRTNQLNFSGRKYSRDQLRTILEQPEVEKLVLRTRDRYGSYGTVGFALVEHTGEAIRILEFMLSCRVQGKLIEQAFFYHLFEHHNTLASPGLWVNFRATTRNKPAQQVLESLGFQKSSSGMEGLEGLFCQSPRSLHCDFIRVHCTAAAHVPPKSPVLAAYS